MNKQDAVLLTLALQLVFILLIIASIDNKQSWSSSGSMTYLRKSGYVETNQNELLYVDGDDNLSSLELDCLSTLAENYFVTIEFTGE